MIDTKPLKYFLYYFILFLIICFVGITNSLALEVNFENLSVQGYDNNGSSLTSPSVFNCSNGSCGMEITTTANSYGGAWGIQSPIPLISNHSYAITLRIRNSVNTGITLSSKPNIAVGTSMGSSKYNYEHSDFWNTTLHSSATGNMTLQYVIRVNGAASYLIIPFTTSSTFTASFMIDTIIIEDLGTESLTQDEINNSLNNQTNELNNSINNAQNNINSNIDDMEQSIIDSNNQTQDVIKDQFQECSDSLNLFNLNGTRVMPSTASVFGSADNFNVSGATNSWDMVYFYIGVIDYDIIYRYSSSSFLLDSVYVNVTNSNDYSSPINLANDRVYVNSFISNSQNISNYKGKHLWISLRGSYPDRYDSVNYTNFVISSVPVDKYYPYGEQICTNRIDETNNQLGNLNDSLNDDDSSGATSEAEEFFSGFTTDTFGLTSIITAPLNLIGSITSSSCSPLGLPLPYVNKTLSLPCMGSIYQEYFGSFLTIYQTITFGIVAYWVCVRIFNLVKDFKNPDHDEIEVLDL